MEPNRLERVLAIGRELVGELELEPLLQRILEVAREVTSARYAALGVLDDAREELERFLTSGLGPDEHAHIGQLPRGHGVLGVLISDPRPLRLVDVGKHPKSYGFPIGHPPMRSFLGVPVVIQGRAWGNLYLTEKEDGPFTAEDENVIVMLADWAAVAVRNARLHRAERRRRAELEHAVRVFEATTEITRALGGEIELDPVLELIVKRGRALVQARCMVLSLVEGDEIVVGNVAGQLDRRIVGQRLPLAGSVAGEVLESGRPHGLAELSDDANPHLQDYVTASCGLIAPMIFRGRRLGVLAAFDREVDGPQFTSEDERLVLSFAAAGATAVATAQLVAAQGLRRALRASEEERRRWARELHDETLQDLAALSIFLSDARYKAQQADMAEVLDKALGRVSRASGNLRALITELRPAALDKLGLEPALGALAESVQDRSNVAVELEVDVDRPGRERLPRDLEVAIYRIVQEALTNVVKHADATRVSVTVHASEKGIEASITDDGAGHVPSDDGKGFGVVGMRERAVAAGGSFSLRSAPGAGTAVEAIFPTRPDSPSAPTAVPAPELEERRRAGRETPHP